MANRDLVYIPQHLIDAQKIECMTCSILDATYKAAEQRIQFKVKSTTGFIVTFLWYPCTRAEDFHGITGQLDQYVDWNFYYKCTTKEVTQMKGLIDRQCCVIL